jgi:NADPH-dependent glutamate synthase beta subunit-like oxidoreductase
LLTYGIPPYRLPRAVLFKEIDIIRGLGVSVLTDHPVENPALLLDEGFDAVFLACGLWGRGGTRIKGCDLKGVLHWIDFLAPLNEKLAEGDSPSIALGNEVIVIGGGNAAIDCARSAARLGAIVTILYRRVEPDMPAWEEERRAAREENISLECCVAPVEYFGEGGVLKGVRLVRTSQGEPDGTGRCRPVPMEGSEFAMNCDTVIEAVGLRSDPKAFPDRLWKDGLIEVREGGFYTMLPGIFAGGDVVSGGATVVRAVADGAGAAEEIDVFLAHGAD